MTIGAEHGQYLVHTHIQKIRKIQCGGLNPLKPSLGTPLMTGLSFRRGADGSG